MRYPERIFGHATSFRVLLTAFLVTLIFAVGSPSMKTLRAQDNSDERIKKLEDQVKRLTGVVQDLQKELESERSLSKQDREKINNDIADIKANPIAGDSRLHIGGYGEMHLNRVEGPESDIFDFHRFVIYTGYDFNDWISLHSELEVEHSFVSDGHGETVLEQAYIDMQMSQIFNFRAGRVLAPLGITNQRHEPTTFNGVERPTFDTVIIPTTWSLDGAGFYGDIIEDKLKYELYVAGGLNGAGFNAMNGIRGARIKERPSAAHPAFTGRLDWFPLEGMELKHQQQLRLGASWFFNDVANGNRGADPEFVGGDPDITIYSLDAEYKISKLDFRGAWAMEKIGDAEIIGNNVASEIMGWYLEAGWHFMPDSMKKGKLENADAVLFARYEDIDTQKEMPRGILPNKAGDRYEWTYGVNFYPTNGVVIKFDYQHKEDAQDGVDPRGQFNIGIGFDF